MIPDFPHGIAWKEDRSAGTTSNCRSSLLGVKGAGEGGTVGAPAAVIHAILDALAPVGVAHLDIPATPERVWRAIRDARAPSVPELVPRPGRTTS